MKSMRGDKLREHILWAAKDVFLEMGFERASMDEVAARAKTSKRTLYAHFENKEKLYLACVDLVRGMFLGKLKTPGEYPGSPAQALTMFCGRYLEMLLYAPTIKMCRMSMAEASRFPEGSARYFDVIFTTPREELGAYLKETFKLSAKAGAEAAQELLSRVLDPRFQRALFGLEKPLEIICAEAIQADFDLKPVRKIVAELIESLQRHR